MYESLRNERKTDRCFIYDCVYVCVCVCAPVDIDSTNLSEDLFARICCVRVIFLNFLVHLSSFHPFTSFNFPWIVHASKTTRSVADTSFSGVSCVPCSLLFVLQLRSFVWQKKIEPDFFLVFFTRIKYFRFVFGWMHSLFLQKKAKWCYHYIKLNMIFWRDELGFPKMCINRVCIRTI